MNLYGLSYSDFIYIYGNGASLARALDIEPQAVYQWHGCVPKLRLYELREKIECLLASDPNDPAVDPAIRARAQRVASKKLPAVSCL